MEKRTTECPGCGREHTIASNTRTIFCECYLAKGIGKQQITLIQIKGEYNSPLGCPVGIEIVKVKAKAA